MTLNEVNQIFSLQKPNRRAGVLKALLMAILIVSGTTLISAIPSKAYASTFYTQSSKSTATVLYDSSHQSGLSSATFTVTSTSTVAQARTSIYYSNKGGLPDYELDFTIQKATDSGTYCFFGIESTGVNASAYTAIQSDNNIIDLATTTQANNGCTLLPGVNYNVRIRSNWSFSWLFFSPSANIKGNGSGLAYLELAGDGGFTPDDTSTRIISVVPTDNSTVATSTSFALSVTGYISPDDYEDNMAVFLKIGNDAVYASQMTLVGLDFTESVSNRQFKFYPTASGSFSFSTTTNIQQIGNYDLDASINQTGFNLWTFMSNIFTDPLNASTATGGLLASTSTQFIVATSTAYDALAEGNVSLALNLLKAKESGYNCDSGQLSAFKPSELIYCIMIPTKAQFKSVFDSARNGFLLSFPWGYVTRTYNIMTNNASSTLPDLKISIPSNVAPAGYGMTFDLTPWQGVKFASELGNYTDVEGDTFRDVAEPYWSKFWYILFILVVVFRLLNVDFRGFGHDQDEWSTTETFNKSQQIVNGQ